MISLLDLRAPALAVLLLLAPAAAAAQDLSELEGLLAEPVVSSASRSAEAAALAPATTSTISADDLRRQGITTLDEAINFLASGLNAEAANGYAELGARGVLINGDYGNHVLLLLDGHPLNEEFGGATSFDRTIGIPFDLVDHIEVVVGPGSVLYGSSAMLGVIDVVTVKARDLAGVHLVAEGGHPTSGRLAGAYGAEGELAGHHAEAVVGVEWYRSHGPDMNFAPQDTPAGPWGGWATHRYNSVPTGYARAALGDFSLALRATQAQLGAVNGAGTFDDPDNWERNRWLSGDLRWGRLLTPRLDLSVRLYADFNEYEQHLPDVAVNCLEGQDLGCTYRYRSGAVWGGSEVIATYDWAQDGHWVTLAGADVRLRHQFEQEHYDATGGTSVQTSTISRRQDTLGAYLQQTARPLAWLSANLGVRLDQDRHYGSAWSPRAALVASAWQGGTVKAIYSTAFRAPTAYETTYADPTYWISTPDLGPERVTSCELVVEQRFGAEQVRLSAFRSDWSDLVVTASASQAQIDAAIAAGALQVGTTEAFYYANASRIVNGGVTADWDGSGLGRRLRYGASLTISRARAEENGGRTRLPAAAELFGNARVSYELGEGLPTLALAGHLAGKRLAARYDLVPVPDVKPQVELRAAVSGPIGEGGLSYRVVLDWAALDVSPYGVGPNHGPQLLPYPPLQAYLLLRYDQ